MADKIQWFTALEKLELGKQVWAYRFMTNPGPVWVLWYDDGKLYLPGQTPLTLKVELPFPTAAAILTWTPTSLKETQARHETLAAVGGALALTLDSTPVFIETVR